MAHFHTPKGLRRMKAPPAFELQKLEDKLEKALNTGDRSDLRVLGYGEISCVLHLDWEGSGFACKRCVNRRDCVSGVAAV